MLLATLSAVFRARKTVLDGQQIQFNYVLRDYNPAHRALVIDAPMDDSSAFIFQHATRKISDLQLRGSFGSAKQVGLVWNQPEVRIFSVLLEMNTTAGAEFYIVRWALKITVFQSFFDTANAVIHVDSAFTLTSLTQSTLLGQYLVCNGVPELPMVRSSAAFSKDAKLVSAPQQYEEACGACFEAMQGRGCSACAANTLRDEVGACTCAYANLKYGSYDGTCVGDPVRTTEAITQGNAIYFMECTSRISLTWTYSGSSGSNRSYSLFKDDSCGLNNIKIYATVNTTSSISASNKLVGISLEMTKNVSFLDLSIFFQNNNQKLDVGSLMYSTASSIASSLSIENLYMHGGFRDQGNNRNKTEQFRFNGMFREVKNVNLSFTNISFMGYKTYSYWDGTYLSMGIGILENSNLTASLIYFGDNQTLVANPIASLDFGSLEEPVSTCKDKMSYQVFTEAQLFASLPSQLSYQQNDIDADEGVKIAGLIGKANSSGIWVTQTMISLVAQDSYGSSKDFGILVVDFVDSTLRVNLSSFSGRSLLYGYSGLITNVTGSHSVLSISASVNLSTTRSNSGVIGVLAQGIVNLNVFLKMNFSSGNSAGLVANMMNGAIKCEGAFGTVKLGPSASSKEVGIWAGGQFDGQVCSPTVSGERCSLESVDNSFINIPDVDGACKPQVSSNEPIGLPVDSYFFPCQSDVRLRIYYIGKFGNGNLSLVKSQPDCNLVNIKVTGSFKIDEANATFNLSGLVNQNYKNMTNVVSDIVMADYSGKANATSMIAIALVYSSRQTTCRNITLRGTLDSSRSGQKQSICGMLTGYVQGTLIASEISLFGVQASFNYMELSGLVIGAGDNSGVSITLNNLIIDDYRSASEVPDFTSVSPYDAVDVPCTTVGDASLQLGARFKNLLKSGSKPSYLKAVSQVYKNGAVMGRIYGNLQVINATLNIDAWLSGGSYYNGALTGQIFVGDQRFNNTFLIGQTQVNTAGIIGYVWDNSYFSLTIEYNFTKLQNAFITQLSSSYDCEITAMVNIQMTGAGSAGFFMQYGSSTQLDISGIITKCDTCYLYGSSYLTCLSKWTCRISETTTCPA